MSERESKRLKRSFIKLSAYLQNSSAMVMALDPEGHIVLVNRIFEEATGYQLAEIQGRFIWDIFMLPGKRNLVRSVFHSFNPDQMPSEYTGTWLTRDGSTLLIAWSNKILFDKDGELEDTSAPVSTSPSANGRRKHCGVARHKFRSLIEGAMDIIAIIDEDGTISFVSPSVERVLGYGPEDLIGTSIFELLYPEEMPRYLKVMGETLDLPGSGTASRNSGSSTRTGPGASSKRSAAIGWRTPRCRASSSTAGTSPTAAVTNKPW